MISNPQLTKQEQQVLTQEYHSYGEIIEACAIMADIGHSVMMNVDV